nr:hypothetical protein [Tanacetum cinerariifolium]
MAAFDYHLNPLYPIKECSSCGALYTTDYCCSEGSLEDKIIRDLDKTPDLSQQSPQNCPKCGNPVDGHYCQGCALLRKKFKEDLFTYCIKNGILQYSSEPSNDNTNVVNALQELLVKISSAINVLVSYMGKETILEIELSFEDKHCQSEDILELFRRLHNDVQNIHEELAVYINTPSWDRPTICYDDDDDDEDYAIAVTPSLSTEEPDNSLSMGDEHLDTISTMESDEFIKSSVENLVSIPSEFEGIPDNMCDVPFHDNSLPLDALPPDSELVSLEVMEIVIPEVGGIGDDILLTIKDDILREKLLNVNLLIANIDALNDNPTPSFDFMTKSSSTSLNFLLEETNTFDNSLLELETFCFDLEKISSGSTTTYSDISFPEYEVFYDDHVKDISSGSTTTHSDCSLYDLFIFDLSINPFSPVDMSDFYEFIDELAYIISSPEYDCFCFKNEPNSGGFHYGCGGGYFSNKRTKSS